MKYDFTSILDRRNKDALAVDALGKMPDMAPNPPKEGFDIIPMWVADMNFPVLPAIQEAMITRVSRTSAISSPGTSILMPLSAGTSGATV